MKNYAGIEALITDIKWYERELDAKTTLTGWTVLLTAEDGTKLNLNLPLTSNPTNRFMKLAENIDFSRPVTIKAWKDDDKTAFYVAQDGKSIPQKYNRENLPEAKQKKSGKWDFSAQEDFLLDVMNNNVIPKLKAVSPLQEDSEDAKPAEDAIPF